MAYDPRRDEDIEMVFAVKVKSFGDGSEHHQREVTAFLWTQLNNGFGADRVQVWRDGKRVFYDPFAKEGEQISNGGLLVIGEGVGSPGANVITLNISSATGKPKRTQKL